MFISNLDPECQCGIIPCYIWANHISPKGLLTSKLLLTRLGINCCGPSSHIVLQITYNSWLIRWKYHCCDIIEWSPRSQSPYQWAAHYSHGRVLIYRVKLLTGNQISWQGVEAYLSSYPGYFWEPHWISMGLPEISRLTWQLCVGCQLMLYL